MSDNDIAADGIFLAKTFTGVVKHCPNKGIVAVFETTTNTPSQLNLTLRDIEAEMHNSNCGYGDPEEGLTNGQRDAYCNELWSAQTAIREFKPSVG